jgi:hypothetical protein
MGIAEEYFITASGELETEMEKSGQVPKPQSVVLVKFKGPLWTHFPEFLRDTAVCVDGAFRCSDKLSYKILPYSRAMPEEGENAAEFFFRNMHLMGANPKTLQHMAEATSANASRTDEFNYGHFHTGIYSGEKIIQTETKEQHYVKDHKKRVRNRIVTLTDPLDISFGVGFTQQGYWFWGASLDNLAVQKEYHSLIRQIESIDVVRMMNKEDVHEEGINLRMLC